jgi:hypothetical protein
MSSTLFCAEVNDVDMRSGMPAIAGDRMSESFWSRSAFLALRVRVSCCCCLLLQVALHVGPDCRQQLQGAFLDLAVAAVNGDGDVAAALLLAFPDMAAALGHQEAAVILVPVMLELLHTRLVRTSRRCRPFAPCAYSLACACAKFETVVMRVRTSSTVVCLQRHMAWRATEAGAARLTLPTGAVFLQDALTPVLSMTLLNSVSALAPELRICLLQTLPSMALQIGEARSQLMKGSYDWAWEFFSSTISTVSALSGADS